MRAARQNSFPWLEHSNDCESGFVDAPAGTVPATPRTVFLELTAACNSRCSGCSNVFISRKPSRKIPPVATPLDIADWGRIIEKLADYAQLIKITGGEPTLYKHFGGLLNVLEEYRLPYILFSNARWTNPSEIIEVLNQTNYLGGLLISLHGRDAATHDAFTLVPGSFDEAVQNIKRTTAIGLPVVLSSIITKYNFQQTRAIYELGQQLGVEKVVFNRYIGQVSDSCAPTPTNLKNALNSIEMLRDDGQSVKLSVTIPQCFRPNSTAGCGAGDSFWTIDPWGNVKPCNHAPLLVGNLLVESIEQIENSAQLAWWRGFSPAGCESCSLLMQCGGGCRAEAMLNQSQQDTLIRDLPFDQIFQSI
jgi:radical SAM protein with 4Fe4S-binding SPASM domain